MTKISNQIVYIPDAEINGLDYFIGTDQDNAKKTVNFRVEDLGSHFNMVNGVRNFDFLFYQHHRVNPKPTDGYFYSNGNTQIPEDITYFIFPKKTARDKDASQFFDSIATDNPFDLIISQKVDNNTVFFFRINSIETFTNYYKFNVSEVFFPNGKSLDYILSYAVFNLKSEGNPGPIPTKTSDLINDGSDGTSTYVELDDLNTRLQLKQNLPTGFITGLQLSIVDSTTARIETGAYIISNFSDLTNITVQIKQVETPIDFTPAYLNTSAASYIALDVDMNVVQSSTPFTNEQRRTLCIIGAVIHSNLTSINLTNEIKAPIVAPTNQLHDFLKAVGFLNLSGNIFGANGSNLKLNKTSGVIWGLGINANDYLNPHQLSLPELTALQFKYRTRNISVVPESAYTTDLDVANYDFNGAITPVPNNKYTIQRINIFQSGEVRIQYGQNLYNTLDQAKAGVALAPFVNEQNISDNAIFRAYLIVKRETTDLSLAISNGTAEFLPVSKFGNIQGGGAISLTASAIITALGYTPENVANKVVDFSIVNDTLYPTVQAVKTETDLKLPKDLSVLPDISLPLLDTDLAVLVRGGVAYKVAKSDLIPEVDTQDNLHKEWASVTARYDAGGVYNVNVAALVASGKQKVFGRSGNSLYNSLTLQNYLTSTATGQNAGLKENNVSHGYIRQGFDSYFMFANNSSDNQHMTTVGFYGLTTVIPNLAISSFTGDFFGVGNDVGDTNLSFYAHRVVATGQTASYVKVDCGANFPAHSTTDAYLLRMEAPKTEVEADRFIKMTITNVVTGAEFTHTFPYTETPVLNRVLLPVINRNNRNSGTATNIRFGKYLLIKKSF